LKEHLKTPKNELLKSLNTPPQALPHPSPTMEKLLISSSTLIGTLIALNFKGRFHRAITFALTISLLLVWTSNLYIITGSFVAFVVLSITTFIYGITVSGLTKLEKISIISMGLMLTINSSFKLLHLPGEGVIKLSLAIPIVLTFATYAIGRKLTREMSFMIIWWVYAVVDFLEPWVLWL
jgi:hydrogenase/urease accessory protein HupE